MAGTASPPSEPGRSEPGRSGLDSGAAEGRREALARFLAEASGAEAVEIGELAPLRGGAIQENWAVDARLFGAALPENSASSCAWPHQPGLPRVSGGSKNSLC